MSLEARLRLKRGAFSLEVHLELPAVGYTVMLGPSGSGKSLTLKALAGLVPAQGSILLDGRDLSSLPPEKRGLVYLPQGCALFPHLRVEENILFPFRARGRPVDRDLFAEVVETFALGELLDRWPGSLSGGEAQRVALARAICACPRVLLLDEPLSSLDFHLRLELVRFLQALPERFSLSVLQVTHDPFEAALLARKLYLMRQGRIVLSGKPEKILGAEGLLSPALRAGIERFARLLREGGTGGGPSG